MICTIRTDLFDLFDVERRAGNHTRFRRAATRFFEFVKLNGSIP